MDNKNWLNYKVLPSLDHRQDNYPYPIYDWRKEELYIKKRTSKDWAWEFFRRNAKYQYDNDRYHNKGHFPEFEIIYPEQKQLKDQKKRIESARFLGIICDEMQLLENQINTDFYCRNIQQKNGTTIPIKDAIWDKYGIFPQRNTLLHDPRLDLPEHNFFLVKSSYTTYIPYVRSLNQEDQHSLTPLIPENIVFRLSANKSIKRQCALVKEKLIERRELLGIPSPKQSPRKVDDSKYIKYIRMLDAFAFYKLSKTSRVNNQIAIEIVDEIEPLSSETKSSHNSRLNDWRKPAFHLVESGYLDILDKE